MKIVAKTNIKDIKLMKGFTKLLSLSLWLIPLGFFNKFLITPFFQDKMHFLALDSKHLMRLIGYTKLDVHLISLPLLAFIIAMLVLINRASTKYRENKNNVNEVVIKTHFYLLISFFILLLLFQLGITRAISPYFYGY